MRFRDRLSGNDHDAYVSLPATSLEAGSPRGLDLIRKPDSTLRSDKARSGYRPDVRGIWLKVKNPGNPAMIRAREEW
jgi:hypothetical protein